MRRLPAFLKTLSVFFFLAIVVLPAASVSHSATYTAAGKAYPSVFNAVVQYRSVAYTGENVTVYVNGTYGFENYNLTVYFAGNNLTGFRPTNTYHNYSVNNPYFSFNITAPTTPQMVYMYVVLSATDGSGTVKFSSMYPLKVVSPMILHATVSNPSSVPVYNTHINFFIDGISVASRVVPYIAPHGKVVVSVTLALTVKLSSGEHTLTVSVNSAALMVNGAVSQYTSKFYYGTPPNYTWIYYIAAAVIAFMAFMAFAAGKKRTPGMPKWKRK